MYVGDVGSSAPVPRSSAGMRHATAGSMNAPSSALKNEYGARRPLCCAVRSHPGALRRRRSRRRRSGRNVSKFHASSSPCQSRGLRPFPRSWGDQVACHSHVVGSRTLRWRIVPVLSCFWKRFDYMRSIQCLYREAMVAMGKLERHSPYDVHHPFSLGIRRSKDDQERASALGRVQLLLHQLISLA
jgi:hypothetical protein